MPPLGSFARRYGKQAIYAVAALTLGAGAAVALVSDTGGSVEIDDATVFCTEFVPSMEASNVYIKWARTAPLDRDSWIGFRTGVCTGTTPLPPAMNTQFGRALIAAGKMALPEVVVPPPTSTTTTTEPPPTTTTEPPTTTEPIPPPPTTTALRWGPPGYDGSGSPRDPANFPGYTVITATTGAQTLNLSNTTDYFINLGAKSFGSGRALVIVGGRNVVIVGGSITTGHGDDFGIQIDGGAPGAIVHIEGVSMNTTNAVTLRSPRYLQIENCRFVVSSTTGAHSDIVQVWMNGGKSPGIRIHRLTAYSNFSFLSDFTDEATQSPFGKETPTFWELYDVDMHSTYIGNWMGHPTSAVWRGSNNWLETSTESSGNRRRLGDQLRFYGLQYMPQAAAFQYFDADNNLLFTSSYDPVNGYAPADYGRAQGDRMRYQSVYHPLLAGMEWRAQVPTEADGADANGNFVPASLAGVNYVSPGYR